LTVLDNLLSITNDSSELAYAERWRCIMQIEQDVKAGNINLSDIQDYTSNCALIEGMGAKSLILSNKETSNGNELIAIKVIPNPVKSQSEIIVSLPEETSGVIEITDIHGRNIKSYSVIGNANIIVTNDQFPKGTYTIKLMLGEGLVKTARMVIQ
ncbi:MAG: T9SS type A sorting domain-containing protein, partial [Bacteroidota bacterium]